MEKINKLRRILNIKKIDGYLIPKNDEFFGEYVHDYNDRLNYISNFKGSYGFCLILKKKKLLIYRRKIYPASKKTEWRFFQNNNFSQKNAL